MAKVEAAKAVETNEFAEYTEVSNESFLWRGRSSTTPLVGRPVMVEQVKTRFANETNPTGVSTAVTIRLTKAAAWRTKEGQLIEAPAGADVKMIINAGLRHVADKAAEALEAGRCPNFVIRFTGEEKDTPRGKMPIYSLKMEPRNLWPTLVDFAPDMAPIEAEPAGHLHAVDVKQLHA